MQHKQPISHVCCCVEHEHGMGEKALFIRGGNNCLRTVIV